MARPMIYMVHPNGSRMPVYSEWQEKENLKNGWAIEQPEAVEEFDDLAIDPAPKRRGRPPKNG